MVAGIQLAPLFTEIKVDIKGFKDDMSKAAVVGMGEAKKISDSLSTTTKVGEKLSDVGSSFSTKVSLPLAGIGIAAGKMAMDFETSFAKASTLLDSNQVDFGQYKDDLLTASTESKVAVNEFSEAVYESISSGVDQKKAIEFTTEAMKLAKGGFTDGAKAVDVLTTAINGYGLESKDARKISDLLITTQNLGKTTVDELADSMGTVIPVAKNANFKIEELSASYAQLTTNGIATAESGTYLKSMLSELTTYGSKTDKVLREMSGKGFSELKKEGKSTSDILNTLSEYAGKSGMTLKDMFGSSEAGSAALVLMKNDGQEYNKVLEAMGTSAGATQAAFKKMDATPAQQLSGAFNSLKNSAIKMGVELVPTITKVAGVISDLADKFGNLSEEQRESILKWGAIAIAAGPALKIIGGGIQTFVKVKSTLGGVTKALGLFQKGAVIAQTATTGLSAASGVAGGAAGLGGLATGLGGALVAAAPFALAIAGVGAAAYGVHKTLSKEVIPTVDLFADKVAYASDIAGTGYHGMATGMKEDTVKISKATKNAVQSYLDMDTDVTKSLYSQKVNHSAVTDQMASDMIGKFASMGDTIKKAEQTQYEERTASLGKFLSDNNALTTAEEAKIVQTEALKHQERITAIDQAQARITEIYTSAKESHRILTEQELLEIDTLQNKMRDNAVNALSKTEEEATVIRERMKEYQGRITAEMAAEMITQANKARDGEIDAAKKKYDEAIRQAARLKEAGTITGEQYNAMVRDAQGARDNQIKAAKDGCKGVKDEIIAATPGIEDSVNTQTGKILTGYGKVKEELKGFFDWLFTETNKSSSTLQNSRMAGKKVKQTEKADASAYNGLSYVPFDGYTVRTHKGEGILTADENKAYRENGGKGGDTYVFNSPKALTPAESARQMKKAKKTLLLNV